MTSESFELFLDNDPGATATDAYGDSLNIVRTESVDDNGDKILTYTATDAAGNTSSVERRIIIDDVHLIIDLHGNNAIYVTPDNYNQYFDLNGNYIDPTVTFSDINTITSNTSSWFRTILCK